jgi:hypothetical protein
LKSFIQSLTFLCWLAETKIEWRVKNWSSVKKKSYIQSDKFDFADFTWWASKVQYHPSSTFCRCTSFRFIGFYTDGDNEESRGYLSVYLFLDVSSVPKGKSVMIEFTLRFINHKSQPSSGSLSPAGNATSSISAGSSASTAGNVSVSSSTSAPSPVQDGGVSSNVNNSTANVNQNESIRKGVFPAVASALPPPTSSICRV